MLKHHRAKRQNAKIELHFLKPKTNSQRLKTEKRETKNTNLKPQNTNAL